MVVETSFVLGLVVETGFVEEDFNEAASFTAEGDLAQPFFGRSPPEAGPEWEAEGREGLCLFAMMLESEFR